MNVEVCKFMVVTTKGRNKEQYLWMKLDLVVAVSYSILIGRVFFYWAIAMLFLLIINIYTKHLNTIFYFLLIKKIF